MTTPTFQAVLNELNSLANPVNAAGMARYGISTQNLLGISLYVLRPLARRIGHDHDLAGRLWASGIHEGRLLAGMVDEPAKVTRRQMDAWASELDSWDICDQLCDNLFQHTPYAWAKARQWAGRKREFVRRAGFAMMACFAVHHKQAPDKDFLALLPLIERAADDDRNFVKKAVNWALRNIGKRTPPLQAACVEVARRLIERPERSARWIGRDALRELTAAKTLERIKKRNRQ